jgi:hypothetical protein
MQGARRGADRAGRVNRVEDFYLAKSHGIDLKVLPASCQIASRPWGKPRRSGKSLFGHGFSRMDTDKAGVERHHGDFHPCSPVFIRGKK